MWRGCVTYFFGTSSVTLHAVDSTLSHVFYFYVQVSKVKPAMLTFESSVSYQRLFCFYVQVSLVWRSNTLGHVDWPVARRAQESKSLGIALWEYRVG